jgi:hypothetical protein
MFRWGSETSARVIDLACIEDLTIQDVADRVGASLSAVKKFYRAHRDEIETARASVLVDDQILARVLDLWGEGLGDALEISSLTGLDEATIRRLLLIAEFDEQPADQGASLELLALQGAHPDRFYEDDIRALTEYGDGRVLPARLMAPDTGLRMAA